MEILPADWEALQTLAGRADLAPERVGMLRRRVEQSMPRPGSPYLLIVGRPDAGIELLLARWLAPEAAEELQTVGDRPLVLGTSPSDVRPRLGIWPTWKCAMFGPGHIFALRTARKPAADILGQVSSLSYVDQVVLVTRMGQPLQMQEREIAQSLAALAATIRVLVVGLPGEEPTEADFAEVSAYAVSQMHQAGFRDGRCLGAGIWFTGGGKRIGTIADVGAFLTIDSEHVAAGRNGMIGNALASLIEEIQQRLPEVASVVAPIGDDECDRLVRELASYLADLGGELNRQTEKKISPTTETLRRYALDALHSWGAYATVEGHWLKLVEQLRPGTQTALLAEAQSAFELLEFEPGSLPAEAPMRAESSPMVEKLIVEGKRAGISLASALVGYTLAIATLGREGVGLPPLVSTILSYAFFVVSGVLGYAAARPFFRVPRFVDRVEPAPVIPAAVHGWLQLVSTILSYAFFVVSGVLGYAAARPFFRVPRFFDSLAWSSREWV